MLSKTDIKERLEHTRSRRVSPEFLLEEVRAILEENQLRRDKIVDELHSDGNSDVTNRFDLDQLEAERIFQLEDIRNICVTYRLRFLDARFFKGDFPDETVTKIRELEDKHGTRLKGFKIVAPSKRLLLENADDPLLFAPMGNDYYYLVDKWGDDLHPLRKWLMWPYRNFENLIVTIFLVSVLLTLITPVGLLHKDPGMQEYILLFLFMFKSVGGVVLYYGFAKGKNFNNAIWDSKYYNA